MLLVCVILMAFGSNSIQLPWPSSTLPSPSWFYRGLVTPNRRYFMHMPNFVVHRSRPELLRPIAPINGLYHPYYFDPNLKNTIPAFGSIQPTAIFPATGDESLGENDKVDTEIIEVEDVADTIEKPKDKEPTNDNDVQEVEIDEMGNDENELPNDQDLDRNRFYQYYYLRGQPQFSETKPMIPRNFIYRMMNNGKETEPVKLTKSDARQKTIRKKILENVK